MHGFSFTFMILIQKLFFFLAIFHIIALNKIQTKIVDFSSDNIFFHPFVQKIRNFRSQDYLIKLLKRNLEAKRKLTADTTSFNTKTSSSGGDKQKDPISNKCPECINNCKCGSNSNYHKKRRCQQHGGGSAADEQNLHTLCESEGIFTNPHNCQQFYICFHNERDPIAVMCPNGSAFDTRKRKCTRKAARNCRKLTNKFIIN